MPLPTLSRPALFCTLCVLAVLFYIVRPAAARQTPPVRSLEPGQRLPEARLSLLLSANGQLISNVSLSEYRGKLLLLDFWATWCSACIDNFEKIDRIQAAFGNRMSVLLVNTRTTGDTMPKLKQFFENSRKDGRVYRFPTVVGDTLLTGYFPHRLLPHYVWIGPDGTVKAITGAEQVTAENVAALLSSSPVRLEQKTDIDTSKPLLLSDHPAASQVEMYSILLKGKVTGLPSGTNTRRTGKLTYGRQVTNQTLVNLYTLGLYDTHPELVPKRFRVELRDSTSYFSSKSPLPTEEWERTHLYSYELLVPPAAAVHFGEYLLSDLDRYSPLQGRIVRRKTPCYGLYLTGSANLLAPTAGKTANTLLRKQDRALLGSPISALVRWLNNQVPGREIFDRTGLLSAIDFRVPDDALTPESIRAALSRYGLELREEEQELDFFIVTEK